MRAVLCVVAAGVLAFAIAAQSNQVPKELSESLKEAKAKREQVKRELNRVGAQRSRVRRDIRAIDADLTNVTEQVIQTSNKLDASIVRRDQLDAELRAATEQMNEFRGRVEERLRQIYRQSDHSVLTLLVASDSVGDLAERKLLLERIATRDRGLFEEFKATRAEFERKKAEQEKVILAVSALKDQHEERQGDLQEVQDEKEWVLRGLDSEYKDLAREVAEWERASRSIAAEIRAYQEGRRGTGGDLSFDGSMIMPASGEITSQFGMRYHPILRRSRPHEGVDIGARNRSPIYAAASGVVIKSGWMSGYGNTVVIHHGDGISTLYGHAAVLLVSEGESVVVGDRIALVGSTGLATGPHLHFEVRVDGSPVNPMRYLL